MQVAGIHQRLRLLHQAHRATLPFDIFLGLLGKLREPGEGLRALLLAAESAVRSRQVIVHFRFVGAQFHRVLQLGEGILVAADPVVGRAQQESGFERLQ